MRTVLYVMAGWVLLNLAFAVGMYFRPIRKRPMAPSNELERSAGDANVAPNMTIAPLRQPTVIEHISHKPENAAGLLLFGFWLGDELRSSNAEKRDPM
ncbi:hypothetical protein [Bradyrhizobium genosp. P]|uniref:hypothetical protein n=1 Tax=Bradyrhizobium genosp. P TaxID=83641 RepID=UPI003CF7AF22